MRPAVLLLMTLLLSGCFGGYAEPQPRVAGPEALLWSHPYPKLVVEFDYAADHIPSPLALEAFAAVLHEQTDKLDIVILDPTPLPDEARFRERSYGWTREELVDLHAEFFDSGTAFRKGEADTAYLHVVYLNGVADMRDGPLGVATPFGIFLWPGSVYTARAGDVFVPPSDAAEFERAVLVHELGHRLGLVNNGAPMLHAREHPESPLHSRYETSVMYPWHSTTDWLRDRLQQDPEKWTYTFDRYDLEDLAALREEGRRLAAEAGATSAPR